MANQKIHEYPIERFVYGDDDYYDIDFWDGAVYQTAKIKGSTIKSAMLSGIAINLTAPSAFIVGGSPTDGTGTLSLTAAGLANQYIRGDGTLATLPTSGGGGNNVNYYLNGGTSASVATYYQMSKTAVIGTGVDFSLAGNGLISQWLTDVGDPNVTEIPSGNWDFEMYFSASSSGGVPKFYVELLKYDGATFTSIANNSATPEGITSGTAIDLYLTSVPVPLTSLAIGDRLAIRVYIVDSVLGRTIKQHTQDSHLCQVITTFSSGLSSINGLTKQTQYLAVGTSGTDFAINSLTDTHTFNLPTASATNRGALSSANWSTFNGKQNQITLTTTGSGAATFISDVLNIPTPSGGAAAGITGQIQFNNGGAFGADSGLFWDNTNKRLGIGATPSSTVRLDVRAQGALSTDIAFRVRNSADTANIISVQGNNTIVLTQYPKIDTTSGTFIQTNSFDSLFVGRGNSTISNYSNTVFGTSNTLSNSVDNYNVFGAYNNVAGMRNIVIGNGNLTSGDTSIRIGVSGGQDVFGGNSSIHIGRAGGYGIGTYSANEVANFFFNDYRTSQMFRGNGSVLLSGKNSLIITDANVTTFMGDGGNTLVIRNHASIPSTNVTDSFQQYSADIVAGNAAPHFRTENGGIIKLYKETTAVTASTLVSNLGTPLTDTDTFDGYTLKQIVKALRNQGLLT